MTTHMLRRLARSTNVIKGGKGDKLSKKDVDPQQLAMGIRVEMEHTGDRKIAEDIAYDHLAEDPTYYTKLSKMEKKKFAEPKKPDRKEPKRPAPPSPSATRPSKPGKQPMSEADEETLRRGLPEKIPPLAAPPPSTPVAGTAGQGAQPPFATPKITTLPSLKAGGGRATVAKNIVSRKPQPLGAGWTQRGSTVPPKRVHPSLDSTRLAVVLNEIKGTYGKHDPELSGLVDRALSGAGNIGAKGGDVYTRIRDRLNAHALGSKGPHGISAVGLPPGRQEAANQYATRAAQLARQYNWHRVGAGLQVDEAVHDYIKSITENGRLGGSNQEMRAAHNLFGLGRERHAARTGRPVNEQAQRAFAEGLRKFVRERAVGPNSIYGLSAADITDEKLLGSMRRLAEAEQHREMLRKYPGQHKTPVAGVEPQRPAYTPTARGPRVSPRAEAAQYQRGDEGLNDLLDIASPIDVDETPEADHGDFNLSRGMRASPQAIARAYQKKRALKFGRAPINEVSAIALEGDNTNNMSSMNNADHVLADKLQDYDDARHEIVRGDLALRGNDGKDFDSNIRGKHIEINGSYMPSDYSTEHRLSDGSKLVVVRHGKSKEIMLKIPHPTIKPHYGIWYHHILPIDEANNLIDRILADESKPTQASTQGLDTEEPHTFAAYRAPAGGMVARGTHYKGGEMVPDMEGKFMNPPMKYAEGEEPPKPRPKPDLKTSTTKRERRGFEKKKALNELLMRIIGSKPKSDKPETDPKKLAAARANWQKRLKVKKLPDNNTDDLSKNPPMTSPC